MLQVKEASRTRKIITTQLGASCITETLPPPPGGLRAIALRRSSSFRTCDFPNEKHFPYQVGQVSLIFLVCQANLFARQSPSAQEHPEDLEILLDLNNNNETRTCLLYTSDAADDWLVV